MTQIMPPLSRYFCWLCSLFLWGASLLPAPGSELKEQEHHLLTQAYSLVRQGDDDHAAALLDEALQTGNEEYRLHILRAQISERSKNYESVKRHTAAALKSRPEDALALAMAGFAYQHEGNREQAEKYFQASLSGTDRTKDMEKNIREALESLKKNVAPARIHEITPQEKKLSHLIPLSRGSVLTSGLRDFMAGEELWKQGQHASAHEKYTSAIKRMESPFLLSESHWKIALHHSREGEFWSALAHGRKAVEYLPESSIRHFDMAYLCLAGNRDREATFHFEQGLKYGNSPAANSALFLDAAYAYKRLNEKEQLLHYLDKTIDVEWNRQTSAEFTDGDRARLYYARREYAYVTREWGAYTSMQYQRNKDDYLWQGIQEVYWQPYHANGRKVQLFAQIGGVPAADNRNLVGDTTYGNFGVRLFPFAEWNLVLTLEQMVKMGSLMRDDSRMRIGYSWDRGMDIHPVRNSWTYTSLFSEATYSFRFNEAYFTGEFRYGRSFKLFGWDKTILTPHLFFYCDSYSEALERKDKWRNFAGPGLLLRQWYREDKYNAPRSYFDVLLQYRINFNDSRYNTFVLGFFNSF